MFVRKSASKSPYIIVKSLAEGGGERGSVSLFALTMGLSGTVRTIPPPAPSSCNDMQAGAGSLNERLLDVRDGPLRDDQREREAHEDD